MAIDLCDFGNILNKIFHSQPWMWLLEHQDFKIFQGKKPQTPSGSPNRHSRDSWVIEKYPDFTFSKGWTVWIR